MANGSVSLPRSSNRTCGFPASGFPTDFMAGPRRRLLRLRPAIELPLKAADIFRRCKAHRQSPSIPDLLRRACLKSGAFAPPELPGLDATMPLSDSRPSRRPEDDVGARAPPRTGLSCLPSSLPSDVPFPIPRRIETVHLSMTSRLVLPSPSPWRVGIRISTFEACSGFTILRPAGSLSRPRRPLSRGSDPASYPAKPLVSYRTHRHLSGWNLPPLDGEIRGTHTVTVHSILRLSCLIVSRLRSALERA